MRKSRNKHVRAKVSQLLLIVAMLIGILLALGFGRGSATAGQPNPPETNGIQRLISDTNGAVKISMNSATGAASFVRLPHDTTLPLPSGRATPVIAAAEAFFERYGDAFGITDPKSELEYIDTSSNRMGNTQVVYRQVYQDIPVFAAILKARFDDQNQLTSVNGTFVPKISLESTRPSLSVQEADQIAEHTVAAQKAASTARLLPQTKAGLVAISSSSHDLAAVSNALYVFRSGLVKGVPGRDHLVYEVEVTNSTISIREFVYVDAHTGAIVDQISGIHSGLDRDVSESSLSNVIWQDSASDPYPIPAGWAGGTVQQVTDWQNEIDGAQETYYLFASMGGWDSYNNGGATMRTVNNDPGISCPNANWNGTSTNYCSDVTGDDTVAHEWGHAYTEYTNNLIYQYQSGALNESYSDVWGEVVDFLNGRGTDAPGGLRTAGSCSIYGNGSPSVDNTYRWLSGEDDPAFGGAIRDMWDPTCHGDPGKVTDNEYWCEEADSGGVHTNSGVPNHAFALLVDGGTYNGQTVNSIGLTKAAHIHWGAQTMLTQASVFADHADALEAACSSLIGVNLPALSTSTAAPGLSGEIITVADCQEVTTAIAAVEFRIAGCNPILDPNAPPLCEGSGTVQTISSEDWEGAALPGGWAVGTHDVANSSTFDTPDWSVVSALPAGANGTYAAFVPDLNIGDCSADDESGALYLDSPPIVIPAGVVPRVAFDHSVATEAGYDGGNLKVSVNGGPWTIVPPDRYEFNAYNIALNVSPNTNPLAGEFAFSGYDGGSWGQSQLNLYGLAAPGDTVRLRFDFGVDGCAGVTGWYVDDVAVYSCSGEQPPVCGDSLLGLGESCDDGNTSNGDGCSSVCQVENGWTCTDPIPPAPGTNIINDGSFEAGPFAGNWVEQSTNFGTPLCDEVSCGTGTGTGPSDGLFWTWFGGIAAYEEGSVSQVIAIPATATDLTFDLEQIVCDSGADYMEMTVDGSQEFFTDGSSLLCGTLGYSAQSVDLSGYADDGAHTVAFHSEIFASNGGGSNFFVDNVVISDNLPISGNPSVCTPPLDNDDFDNAAQIDSLPYNDNQDVELATTAVDDPTLPCGPGSQGVGSVWYEFTPSQSGLLNADTFGSDYDTVLAVWEGSRGSLSDVACNDDSGSLQSQLLDVPLLGGTSYHIEVTSYGGIPGLLDLGVDFVPSGAAQVLSLTAGWNMISSSVTPQNAAMEPLLAGIENDMILIKNGDGLVYWPAMSINEIGSWNVRHGYQIFMNNAAALSIGGAAIDPAALPFSLPAGWNLISYVRDTPMAVDLALGTVSSELILAKDGQGQVYWPAFGINQIGAMQPGEGYQLNMSSAGILTYPGN